MPTQDVVRNSAEVEERIYDLLKRKGPLCASQISVDLLLPLREVNGGLQRLEGLGAVELKLEPDTAVKDRIQAPWRLARKSRTTGGR